MRILVVEDDFTSRKLLDKILSEYGDVDTAVDGEEAVHAFKLAHAEEDPYDLICMDIMMPNVDGQQAVVQIREHERDLGIKGNAEVKIIMVTALSDAKTVVDSFYKSGATSYVVKPVIRKTLIEEIRKLGLPI